MDLLATIVHISDLHFGPVDPGTMDAVIPRLWQRFPWFDGLLGHSYFAATKLDRFYGSLAQEAALLVMT
jgi:hypothetical protein